MEGFRDISWSDNMKRAYRIACHETARKRQDRIFERNAMLRQKIVGCLISLISMVIWISLTAYELRQIFWGIELFPMMLIGFYVMLTDRKVFRDLENAIRKERKEEWSRLSGK
ncbi:MAG: hypothetical protein J6X66_08850 [Lachnospiraceae bacterium]|nr:hypothetical protein [Lachnospiraceae bacterium]